MSDDNLKRGRGPGRPVLENLRNAGPLLREGEITRTHRVRAMAAVHDWFGAMTAEQRGAALARLMAWEDKREPAVIAVYTSARSASQTAAVTPLEDRLGEDASVAVAGPPRLSGKPKEVTTASLDGVSNLRVVSSSIPSSLRNDLRWPPQRYQELEATLSRESALKLETIKGKEAWRTSTGESIRKDTVARLLQAGLLVSD